MSWLSKALGLDKHPAALAAINSVGHSLAVDALASLSESDILSRLSGAVDRTVGPVIDKLPIPAEEAGVAKWYLGNLLKAEIEKELNQFEPAPAPTPKTELLPSPLDLVGGQP